MSPETPEKLYRVLGHMSEHDETPIDMANWGFEAFVIASGDCKTPMCVAGWTVLTFEPMLFREGHWSTPLAEEILGITKDESDYLFCCWESWPIPWRADDSRTDQLAAIKSAMDALCDGSWAAPEK